MNSFKIAWMFPDTLCLHGERGNVLALRRFAEIGGFDAAVDKVDFETKDFDPMDYQLMFFAAGEISSFPPVLEWLARYKDGLNSFTGSGRVMLVTGTSVAMFGDKITRQNGDVIGGLGLFGADYFERNDVYGDDTYFEVGYNGKEIEIIGNQIQMGDMRNVNGKPFGKLVYGYGNSGEDRNEGVLLNNSIFTNALGPVLVSNPRLTAEIIKAAAGASGLGADEEALDGYDDSLERKSFEAKKEFIMKKDTHLTNCPRA